jgi:CubicO group peptidase (beta-lactamase class C family)
MPTPTFRAAAALLLAGPAAAQAPPPAPIAEDSLVRRLAATLDSLAARDRFAGVVVLARSDGSRAFAHAYGYADREAKRPNDLATAFNLGSINKIFTMTAIRQLAAAAKLSLDSTLATYWPDYPNADVARRVTIRQLLEHRSGIGGDIFRPPASGRRIDLRRNADFVPLFAREPLLFAPGADQRYSNAGYVVLGGVIARVSGEDYYDYVRRHVYQPAGMSRTAHFALDSLPPNTAIGYTRGEDDTPDSATVHRNTDLLPGRGSAAGGGYSTADDLLRFVHAAREGRIQEAPSGAFGIAGGAPGVNGVVETRLPGGYDLVALANLDPPAAIRVAQAVRGWLGVSPEPGPRIGGAGRP